MQPRFADESSLAGFDVVMGVFGQPSTALTFTADAPVRGEAMRWAMPRLAGPIDGMVLATDGLDGGYILEVLSIASGNARSLERRPLSAVALTADASTGLAYVAEAAQGADSMDLMQVDVATGRWRPLARLQMAFTEDWLVDLAIEPAAGILLVLDCAAACRLRGVDLADGSTLWSRPSDFRYFVDGPQPLLSRPCGLPCSGQFVDATTGVGTATGRHCEAAVPATIDGETVVATDSNGDACATGADASVVHLYQQGRDGPSGDFPVGAGLRLVVNGGESGYAVPPSMVVLGRDGSLGALSADNSAAQLLDLNTGQLITPD